MSTIKMPKPPMQPHMSNVPKSVRTCDQVVLFRGQERSLREWCVVLRLEYATVAMRYRRGHRDPQKLFRKTPNKLNSDIPALGTKKFKAFIYPNILELLPENVARMVLAASHSEKDVALGMLRVAFTTAVVNTFYDTRIKAELAKDEPFSLATLTMLAMMTPEQQHAIRKFFKGHQGELNTIFHAILQSLVPTLIERTFGVVDKDDTVNVQRLSKYVDGEIQAGIKPDDEAPATYDTNPRLPPSHRSGFFGYD